MTLFFKKKLNAFLPWVITFIFFYFTFRNIQFEAFSKILLTINYWILILSLVPQFFTFVLLAFREKFLLNAIHPFPMSNLFKGTFISFIGNNVLPLRGGEFLKVYYWSKISKKSYVSLLSVAFLERIFDLLILLCIFLMSSPVIINRLHINSHYFVSFFFFVILAITFLIFLDWKYKQKFTMHHWTKYILGEKISAYFNNFLSNIIIGLRVLKSIKPVLLAIFFTAVYWLMNMVSLTLWLLAFHLHISFAQSLIILLIMTLGCAIPSAPGYIGTLDYFTKMALVFFGVNNDTAAAFAVASHLVSIVPFTILGTWYVYPALKLLLKTEKKSAVEENFSSAA